MIAPHLLGGTEEGHKKVSHGLWCSGRSWCRLMFDGESICSE